MTGARRPVRSVAVTGGAQGIGRTLASTLARRGVNVVIGDIDLNAAESTAAELGPLVSAYPLDVRDPASFTSFLDAAETDRPLDALVNNAGIMPAGAYIEERLESTRRQIEINVLGVMHGCNLVLPRFLSRRRGHIVNVASLAGRLSFPGAATYSGTKHFVYGFSRALNAELAKSPVDVSVVLPGFVNTDLTAGFADSRIFRRTEPSAVADAVAAAIERPRFEVFVPRALGPITTFAGLLPPRLVDALMRWSGAERLALDVDLVKRSDYETRIGVSVDSVAGLSSSTDHSDAQSP